jgi:hypothetical protein
MVAGLKVKLGVVETATMEVVMEPGLVTRKYLKISSLSKIGPLVLGPLRGTVSHRLTAGLGIAPALVTHGHVIGAVEVGSTDKPQKGPCPHG